VLMDTRQLAAFCAVVEKRSFSQAAEKLGVTQPAVSLQVRALEERLGTRLIDRAGRPSRPAPSLRVRSRAARRARLALRLRHPRGDRARGRAGARAGSRRPPPPPPLARIRAARPRRDRPRRSSRPPGRGGRALAGRPRAGDARRHAGGRRRPPGDRGGAAPRGAPPALARAAARAGASGVGEDRRRRRLRRCLHLADGDRGRARRRDARGRPRRRSRAGAPDLRRPRPRARARPGSRRLPGLRQRAPRVIVRWGLSELGPLLREVEIERPLLVTSERWRELELPVDRAFYAVRSHVPAESVAAAEAAVADVDGLVALGGGSAIDTAKAVSADAGLPVVSIPTTYSGAEWTPFFGVRDEERRGKGGGRGAGPDG